MEEWGVNNIKIAIAGVGNCASSLIQGLEFYRNYGERDVTGLMHPRIGPYRCGDIETVAAFDVDRRKVGKRIPPLATRSRANCVTSVPTTL